MAQPLHPQMPEPLPGAAPSTFPDVLGAIKEWAQDQGLPTVSQEEAFRQYRMAKEDLAVARRVLERTLPPTGQDGLPTIDLASFLAEPPRVAAPFTVADLFPVTSGVIVLAGPQKTSKTIMALQVAISVAGGNAGVLGHQIGRHGPCLFIEEEGNRDKLRERLAAMLIGLELTTPPPDLHLALFERVQVDDDESMALIAAAVERIRPVAVFLDPLAYLHRQDENDNTAMNSLVMRPLVQLAQQFDVLVTVLHHVTKNGGEGGTVGRRVRGAGGITAASDGNVVFNRTGPTTIRAQGEYRDAAPFDSHYRFDEEHMILVEHTPEVSRKVSFDQVLALVNSHAAVTVSQAMKEWDVSRNTAKTVLFNAVEAGAIDHADDGKTGHLFMALGMST